MEKKWIGFIGIFVVIWISFIVTSIFLVYLASIYNDIMFNEFWVLYFGGFFVIATYFSGERFSTQNSHRSYLSFLFILIIIAIFYYLLTFYVIFPWAEEVGWL